MTEKEKIIEIESYYGQSLSEIVVRLTKEPIVRQENFMWGTQLCVVVTVLWVGRESLSTF